MDSTSTVDLSDRARVSQTSASSFDGVEPANRAQSVKGIGLAKAPGFFLSLACSSFTAVPDPWLDEKRKREAAVTVAVYREKLGRTITHHEALRIAREILESAERERLEAARFEASRGIQWD